MPGTMPTVGARRVAGPLRRAEDRLQSDEEVAARVALNFVRMSQWLPKFLPNRVETVEFVNHSTVRRTVRLDIDLAALPSFWTTTNGNGNGRTNAHNAFGWPLWGGGLLVPIAPLTRHRGASFDVRGSQGEQLPLLTRSEERSFALDGLVQASARRGVPVDDGALSVLRELVREGTEDLRRRLAEHTWGHYVLQDDVLFGVVETLTKVDFLAVVVPALPRQVITYTSLEHIATHEKSAAANHIARAAEHSSASTFSSGPHGMLEKAWNRMGSKTIYLDTPGVGSCGEYHIAVTAPYDLEFRDAELVVVRDDRSVDIARDQDRLPNQAHAYREHGDPPVLSTFRAALHHVPSGVVRSAPLSAAFTTGILAAGALWSFLGVDHKLNGLNSEAGAALLLLVPAAIGTLLAAPTTHSLTAKLLFPTRFLLAASSVMPWVAGIALAANLDGWINVGVWSVSSLVALIITIILGRQYLRLRAGAAARDRVA